MLAIKLARIGKKKQSSFRVIVSEKSRDTRGKYLENLGFYNPQSKQLQLQSERVKYWLGKGALLTPTIHNLLVDQKIVSGPKIKAAKAKKQTAEAKTAEPEEATKEAAGS